MTKYVLKVHLEILHNLFGPSAQIGQLFGIFLKKVLFTSPSSMNKPDVYIRIRLAAYEDAYI